MSLKNIFNVFLTYAVVVHVFSGYKLYMNTPMEYIFTVKARLNETRQVSNFKNLIPITICTICAKYYCLHLFYNKSHVLIFFPESPSEEKTCFRSQEILIVIIVMSVFVFILLVACLAMSCAILKLRHKFNSHHQENESHMPRFFLPHAKLQA